MAGDPGAARPGADDPFGTSRLREVTLAGWRDSPTRFREDANAEEDLARGGYRDRLVVELAQNAADAAARAGVEGRLLLRLRGAVLEVSNTGAPLDAAGVASLASLRASAKRDGSPMVGRFGVGFAAVVAVSDSPSLRSTAGGIRFDADRTRALVAAEPALAGELGRRDGQVPALRLPFPDPEPPAPGFTTTVALPLRDAAAVALVRRLLDDVDDALLLSLPALREVVVETGAHHRRRLTAHPDGSDVVVHDDGRRSRWRVVTTEGVAADEVLADRPVEERSRPGWSVTWAVSLDDGGRPAPVPPGTAAVLHAPTPTDEPLDLPALLLATFPLDPSRRHVAPGALTDLLVGESADAYAALARQLADEVGPAALVLVPGPAPAGALDGRLRDAVLHRLRQIPLLRVASPPGHRVAATDAVALDPPSPAAVACLGPVFDGLVAAEWGSELATLDRLGVRRLPLADALDALVDVAREPAWWRGLYDALDGIEPRQLEGLPVPLTDGRTVRGPRSVVLPAGSPSAADLALLGHRIAHPAAVHPLLGRLGAVEAEPARLLTDPRLLTRLPDADPELVAAVLRTAAAADLDPGTVLGLAELPLPAQDGSTARAGDLVLPGSPLAAVRDPAVQLVHADVVAVAGPGALVGVGVLDRLRVARRHDVEIDPDEVDALGPDAADWADVVTDVVAAAGGTVDVPPMADEVAVVLGVEAVADDAWPTAEAHALLAAPEVRRALVEPVVVRPVSGPAVEVPSPGAWWLREAPLFDGVPPVLCRTPDAEPLLAAPYPTVAVSSGLDAGLLRALGVRSTVAGLLAEPDGPGQLLDQLADPGLDVPGGDAVAWYRAVAALPEARWPDAPSAVRVPEGAGSTVVPAGSVTVVLAPHHLPLVGPGALPGDRDVADLLDVGTSERLVDADPGGGTLVTVPTAAGRVLPGAAARYREHDTLCVAGISVDWWVDRVGVIHAATGQGLARGLAWQAGHWQRRWEVEAVLADPGRGRQADAERPFDPVGEAGWG